MKTFFIATILVCGCYAGFAQPVSPLFARGYTVMPEPQQVTLGADDFRFGPGWQMKLDGVAANDSAVETLRQELDQRFHVTLGAAGKSGGTLTLRIAPDSVPVGETQDNDKKALAQQAYRITLHSGSIAITANAPAGLFYGVETLVQMAKPDHAELRLPEGEIVDWPDVQLREVFWDELRHLDHMDVLEQTVRRAAFFKFNAISLRLNEHFQYTSVAPLVDPYAMTPAELQQLTDYGLHYHVQIIPYLDGPAHVGFMLERQAYQHLREFPETSFEMCSTNPETYKLLQGMQQELINANKGVEYFHLSTDEAWFIGKADNDQCHEAEQAKAPGSPSKLWVDYTKKMTAYLQGQGRKVIFWGETPMQAEDIPLLPQGLINGEVYSRPYNQGFKAHGIPQMLYTNSQPDDPLFPVNTVLPASEEVHPRTVEDRQAQVFNEISFSSARKEAEIMGSGVYAWGDYGPHPETFWLGYAVGAAAAWHPGSPDPAELTESFYRLFYGQGATQMGRLYQLMSTQTQFFATSWDSEPSGSVPMMFGESWGIGQRASQIQTLPLPPVPTPDYLRLGGDWLQENSRRMQLAEKSLKENDELTHLLYANLPQVQFNHYNLEVYLSLAKLCRQNLQMMQGVNDIYSNLETAQNEAQQLHYPQAVEALDAAIDVAEKIRDDRNQALQDVTTTWYETWFPRVRAANGRHVAENPQRFVSNATSEDARRRQVGLQYLIDREFLLPFGDWVNQVLEVRNRYAAAHKLPTRTDHFDWQDMTTLHSQGANRAL